MHVQTTNKIFYHWHSALDHPGTGFTTKHDRCYEINSASDVRGDSSTAGAVKSEARSSAAQATRDCQKGGNSRTWQRATRISEIILLRLQRKCYCSQIVGKLLIREILECYHLSTLNNNSGDLSFALLEMIAMYIGSSNAINIKFNNRNN